MSSKKAGAITDTSQRSDPCLAFVDPPCARGAIRHNLCVGHMDGYEGTNWTRVEFTGSDGRQHSYIALDVIPPPALIDSTRVVRPVGTHKPAAGRCPCCSDPFASDTNTWVLHTTWHARGDVTSVCAPCGRVGHQHVKVAAEAVAVPEVMA